MINGAADQSGQISKGDVIVAVNGKSTDKLATEKIAELFESTDKYVILTVKKGLYTVWKPESKAYPNFFILLTLTFEACSIWSEV